ncbi:epiplakin [Tiliqua scincoides]|uniref:epiplakin n=1 Tax=Tiliqua scincoides TaxID=71010 RepID=UPI0034620567
MGSTALGTSSFQDQPRLQQDGWPWPRRNLPVPLADLEAERGLNPMRKLSAQLHWSPSLTSHRNRLGLSLLNLTLQKAPFPGQLRQGEGQQQDPLLAGLPGTNHRGAGALVPGAPKVGLQLQALYEPSPLPIPPGLGNRRPVNQKVWRPACRHPRRSTCPYEEERIPSGKSAAQDQAAATAMPSSPSLSSPAVAAEADRAIRSIAGVYVESSTKSMALIQAAQAHLLPPELALALLEAQAATGGIVDLAGQQLVSVAEALVRGLVGLEMKERLLQAERAATGFADPYTEGKVSLFQAIQKELIGRQQGLRLLETQIATGGVIEPTTGSRVPLPEACEQGYLDEELSDFLSDPENEEAKGFWDPSSDQKVTYREMLRRCIADPATGLLLLPLKISFPGLRGAVCSHELLDAGIIDSATFRALHCGEVTAQDVAKTDRVEQYLSGTSSVAGVAVLQSNECKSLYQALTEHLLMPGTAMSLMQAQAATGCLVDPVKNEKFTVDAAVRAGLIGPELHEKLSAAERAITGYKDPYTGETLSLFQAMKKGLVPRDPGIFLLEAQLATGGVVDPHTHHRLPVEVAFQRNLLDRATHTLLCHPTDDIRGFFEPNSRENLSYAELLLRCVTDPDTGLCLLPLSGTPSGEEHSFIDHGTQLALRNTEVSVTRGRFKGKPVSLWRLLFSDYFTGGQRRAFIQQLHSGQLSLQGLANHVCHTVQQVTTDARVTFEGLRDKVTPAQLLSSQIIDKEIFEKLTQGETLAEEVVCMGAVKKYLEGTGSISGLLLTDSQEKVSIYQARRRGLLRPGTALVLLEAQAATGHIIDPAANKKYSVDEALRANVVGPDIYEKLLAAEKAVTGYRDPYTGHKISLFQAMMKELIVREHAIRLLEAQIATGGIIDPVNSHRLPVEAAYKRGYFDRKMNLILSDPSDDTKGFFDPNTQENLTYLQLKERCITEPTTGLCLLPLNSKKRQLIDGPTKQALRNSWLLVKFGRFQGQRVSVWDLLNSEYFSEGKRREVLTHYCLQKVTLPQIRAMLEEEMKKWAPIRFPALKGSVTAHHLMESGLLERAIFEQLLDGAVSPEEVLRLESVRKYLYGTGSIGGLVLQPSNERVSLYEAMKRNVMLPGVVLPLLEAQAATGFIIDPVNQQKLCLDGAVREGLVGPELYEKLQRAEKAVTGYRDPFTGQKISLFQAMKKGLVASKQGMKLMDAQLATGGVIDPHRGHYVPIELAQKKGYLDEDLSARLSNPSPEAKAFCTPDSRERVTYSQLLAQCQRDPASGIHLLPVPEAAPPACTEEETGQLFRETFVEEKGVSLWELLHSGYFTEEQRRDFLEQCRSEAMAPRQLVTLVLGLMRETEMRAQSRVSFQGLRGAVPAVWLLDTGIISGQTFQELVQGQTTAREVSSRESVQRYLQGTGSIAGVFVQASQEKMGVYQAMQNSLLLPGMAAQLLEAQAATGTLTDPATGQRLGVEEAVKAGLVGEELAAQLLQAERALMGYTDPYSGKLISICQAIRKELIPANEGIPLLEAQLATGGIIDPVHRHHLPLHAAYKHNFYDKEMHKTLAELTTDTRVFFDPNTQESVTYQQLKDRCIPDAHTGLLLLPLSEDAAFYGDSQTMKVLKSVPICVNVGRFKGQEVSLWNLLNSEYVTSCTRRELMAAYKEESAKSLQDIVATVTKVIEETEQQGRRFSFQGLRKQVSASDLFQSQLIDKATLDELSQGRKTVQDVMEMDSVRQYLEGCNFIAGVLLQPDQDKMSIYQAMRRGLLRPGAALVLLEAQAATGFLIDPVKNLRLSVDEALQAGLIGTEIYEKLLRAEKAVTGYTDPYTKGRISLFEAMRQDLIVRSHGIRLLEAQIATGGIIDPVHSHRIPVEVAYKRGYFDEAMNHVLLDPEDDTKGFFDPNTHENLTYLQLLERCIQDPETGLYMLQIVRRGEQYFYIDEPTKQFLQAQVLQMSSGMYRGQRVSVWDLLCSPYIQEHRRKELVHQYKCGGLTLEQLSQAITSVVEDTERSAQQLRLQGPRGEVSAAELFNSEIIDKKTLDGLLQGLWTLQQLAQKDAVKRYLEGIGCIAGISVEANGETLTFCEAAKRGLLSPENALLFLEAQAATGFITHPLEKSRLSVDQAVSAGLVAEDFHEKLLFAEKATTGYPDPSTGNKISLFQAMKRKMVDKALALRLLEAQIATGGIIDLVQGHRLPPQVASRRGYLDDDTFLLLADAECGAKGFVDPNTQERTTYAQLLSRCITDKDTGMHLLPLPGKREYLCEDQITRSIFLSTKVKVAHGKYQGQTLSLWALLTSDYVGKEQRTRLVTKYKQESSALLERMARQILSVIKGREAQRRDSWFQGLRQQVTASELLSADIISPDTMKGLEEGKLSVQDVAAMDSVRQYLEGTGCIAGVLVPSQSDPSRTEKMTVYQAMWKGVLRPGTALVLLEAQAATGFITDPLRNARLSVDDALHSGLVGSEIHHKLLCAEKAVTGYTDPSTGQKLSLFQAMKKDLIVREHGIRLLEAQIATGGIIDPVNSHRVPVDVAYRRGYFDEELNQVLLDPTDDTKGFFDPNTHENLTYMELLRRCRPDPETGLCMLQIQPKSKRHVHLNEDNVKTLKSTRTSVKSGLFQGQELSLWELLFSTYISQNKRQDLLSDFRDGKLPLQEMITIVTSLIEEAEEMSRKQERSAQDGNRDKENKTKQGNDPSRAEQEKREEALKSRRVAVAVGEFQGQKVSVWDLLHSAYFPEEKQKELLQLYDSGVLTLDQMETVVATVVNKTEEEKTKEASPAARPPGHWEDPLRSHTVVLQVGEFRGQEVPLWDLLFSQYIPAAQREELLTKYRSGALSLQDLVTTLPSLLTEAEGSAGREAEVASSPAGAVPPLQGDGAAPSPREEEPESALRLVTIAVPVGELQGSRRSVWELLFSKYVTSEKRQELLQNYRARSVTTEELVRIITALITEMEEKSRRLKFSGLRRQVTASELFDSHIIDQDTLSELTQGTKTVEEVTQRDSVKRYLEGTGCIAGVLVPSKSDPSRTEKMTVYQAMWKGVLRPGTALVLLEAQAATGFIADPLKNAKLSVDEAVSAELVGAELQEKLASAERAVTGYKDPCTGNKISLFQAMKKGLIVQDHGIRLLEAQIATGGIIDPVESHRLPVEVAYQRGYFDEEMNQILSDPTDDTKGFFDPNTHENLTYMQLLHRCVPDPDTGLLMLHVMDKGAFSSHLNENTRKSLQAEKVQVDVGLFRGQEISLWDLLFSRYVPPHKRQDLLRMYKAGTITLQGLTEALTTIATETEERSATPTAHTAPAASSAQHAGARADLEKTLRSTTINMPAGEQKGQQVPVWDLLFSSYVSGEKRAELLDLHRKGLLPLDQLKSVLSTLVTKKDATSRPFAVKVRRPGQETASGDGDRGASSPSAAHWEGALRSQPIQVPPGMFPVQQLSVWEALFSQHISEGKREELLSKYRNGSATLQELTDVLAALLAEATGEASPAPTAAAAPSPGDDAAGQEEDPGRAEQEKREEALKSRRVAVAVGEFQGQKVSVWDLLHSAYFPEEKQKELLQLYDSGVLTLDQMETVVATVVNKTEEEKTKEASPAARPPGHWEDPLRSHTVVLQVGEFRGQEVPLWDLLFSQYIPAAQREELLTKYRSGALSLQDLVTTLPSLLTEAEGSAGREAEVASSPAGAVPPLQGDGAAPSPREEEPESALRLVTIAVPVGELQGSRRSVWELLFSKYVTSEKRQELLQNYRARSVTTEELVRIITALITEMEEKSRRLKFSGLRRQVTASELFDSHIIDQDTLSELTQGTKTVEEVTQRDSVKRYLEGTGCIAGVLVPSKSDPSRTEKMTVYQAMWKGVLRPGTALVLLEAQAATGFIADPLKNAKLSVDEAVSAELVGAELQEKLASAERAVTGYKDPCTGNKISLFQAMKKGLIVQDHGIRLLEAQIATGGIIDPVESHRLPVEVAYQRGYFDEEMNQILSDPTDDTKGFFDPNTHENLTYMQLLHRCVPDPDTGLLMLHVMDKGAFSSHLNENTRKSLQAEKVQVDVGLFRGQEISLWDLLFSRYVPPHKRQDLLRMYKAGTITLQGLTEALTTIATETEERSATPTAHTAPAASSAQHAGARADLEKTLRSTTINMPAGEQKGQQVPVWDLLFSSYVSGEKRAELLDLHRKGLLPLDQLKSVLSTLVTKKDATSRPFAVKVRRPGQETASGDGDRGASSPSAAHWEGALRSQPIQVPPGMFPVQQLSVWEALFSQHISEGKREELLSKYRNGSATLQELTDVLAALLAEATGEASPAPTAAAAPSPGDDAAGQEEDPGRAEQEKREEALKSRRVAVAVGEFQGQKVSVWDLLHSAYFPEEKQKELLQLYDSGVLTLDQMETVVATVVNKTEEEKTKEASPAARPPGHWEDPLRSHTVVLQVGEFRGQEVPLWDLLFSQYIPAAQREELLTKYRSGALSLQDLVTTLPSLLTEAEGSAGREAEVASSPAGAVPPLQGDGAAPSPREEEPESALRLVTIAVPVGELQGSRRSVWELLFSKYVTSEKRQELLQNYRARSVTTEELVRIITALITEMEEKSRRLKFSGLRRQVTASELFDSHIIDQDTLSELTQGTKTVEEVTQRDSVKRYLEGTGCIAGVLVPSKSDPSRTEKMTVYQAMWKGVLRPGTALVLLEAQAATGFIADPLKNAKLSVDEAVSAELVGAELQEKLASAERAVTGYKDPCTGNKISLFQAMKKGLIVQDHGIRLLEAQIATGGIIDPVESHRLPVEVAYQRGYFDEEMNQILSDPTDDTKGFFDPNTHENLTYMQLLHRCVPDPDTGLLMLHVMDKGAFSSHLNENTRKSLQAEKVQVDVGLFRGQEISLWDLLFSRYVPPHKRQDLLRMYKAGTITLQGLTEALTTIATETEERSATPTAHTAPAASSAQHAGARADLEKTLRSTTINMPAGEQKGQQVPVWDLLFSSYVSGEKRAELLDLHRKGLLPLDQLKSVLSTLVTKKDATSRPFAVKVRRPGQETASGDGDRGASSPSAAHWEGALWSQPIQVPPGMFPVQQLSVWEALFSQHISEGKREELLSKYRNGSATLQELTDVLAALLAEATGEASPAPTAAAAPSPGDDAAGQEEDPGRAEQEKREEALKSHRVAVAVGEFQGQKVSVWDLLHSAYFPEEKQKELLQLYDSGVLTLDQMETVVATVVNKTEEEKTKEASPAARPPGHWEDPLRSHTVVLQVGEFRGQEVPLWDLLFSHYFSECRREELLCLYRDSNLTPEELTAVISTLITEAVDGDKKQTHGYVSSADIESPGREEAPGKSAQEEWEEALKSRWVEVAEGQFHGQKVSVWDLLHSSYFPEEKQKELMRLYDSGIITLDQMETVVTTVVNRTEEDVSCGHQDSVVEEETKLVQSSHYDLLQHVSHLANVDITIRDLQHQKSSVWDPFFSRVVSDIRREEILHRPGAPAVVVKERFSSSTTAVVRNEVTRSSPCRPEECPKEDTPLPEISQVSHGDDHTEQHWRAWSADPASGSQEEGLPGRRQASPADQQQLKKSLRTTMVHVSAGEFQGQKVCVLDLLFSKYVPQDKRQELLELYRAGTLSIQEMIAGVTAMIEEAEGLKKEVLATELATSKNRQQWPLEDSGENTEGCIYPLGPSRLKRGRSSAGRPSATLSLVLPAGPSPARVVARGPRRLDGLPRSRRASRRAGRLRALWLPARRVTGRRRREALSAAAAGRAGRRTCVERQRRRAAGRWAAAGARSGRRGTCSRGGGERPGPPARDARPGQRSLGGAPERPGRRAPPARTRSRAGGRGGAAFARRSATPEAARSLSPGALQPRALPGAPGAPRLPDRAALAMLQDKCVASGGLHGAPIMQIREEPHWPFPGATDLREDHVIAGVLKEPSKERLSIQRAMQKGLLTQGTGLALLEHQAASGYIVDFAKNRMLSVRDATTAGLVGREHFNALFVAEKAVTGYTDPFSGNKISLFQAMKKGLVVKDHGIRLLEAQVATGGLIHPMHSHRLPVEQAYKWGYLDAEIYNLISDPVNHSKRCFDPNARESLTYMQLLNRCVLDPVTGLLMFPVDKGSIHLNENLRKSLQSATTRIQVGLFQDQDVSLWDLLFSRYVSPHKRQDLQRQYKAGTITLQDILKILTTIVTETETKKDPHYGKEQKLCQQMALPEKEKHKRTSEKEEKERTLKSRLVEVTVGEFRGQKVSVWDLLHSRYIPKGKRKELLKLYKAGILTTDQMESVVTAIVTKVEEEKAKESGRVTGLGKEPGTSGEGLSFDPQEAQLRQSLQFIHVPGPCGEFKGQDVPVLDLLFSKYFPQDKRQELMGLYREGILSPEQMAAAIHGTLDKAEASKRKFVVLAKRRSPEGSRSRESRVAGAAQSSKHLDDLLKSQTVTLPAGEFQGQQLSVWDLLFSQYLTKDKREELLRKYREGKVSVQELASMLTILAALHDLFYSLEHTAARTCACPTSREGPGSVTTSLEGEGEDDDDEDDDDEDDDDDDKEEPDEKDKVLKSRMVEVPVGEFRGRKVSVWDLLHSRYFPEKKRKEVLKLYRIGILTADQMEKVVTAIVTQVGGDKDPEGGCGSLPSQGLGLPKEARTVTLPKDGARAQTVKALTFEFPVGEFQGQQVSMWDLLFSTDVPEAKRLELLTRYITGALSSQEMVTILTTLVLETHKQRSTPNIPQLFSLLHPEASYMMFGPSQAQRASVHDLCSQEQDAHRAGSVTFSEITMTTTVVQAPEHKQG